MNAVSYLAGTLGSLLRQHQGIVNIVSGAVVIFFGSVPWISVNVSIPAGTRIRRNADASFVFAWTWDSIYLKCSAD